MDMNSDGVLDFGLEIGGYVELNGDLGDGCELNS